MKNNIRHIINLFIATALALLTGSCSDDDIINGGEIPEDHDAVFNLGIPYDGTLTRAVNDREFQVDELTLYFFKAEGFDEGTSTCLYRYDMPVSKRFNGINDGQQTLSFAFPMDIKPLLFPTGATNAVVYAIANTSGTLPAEQQDILNEDIDGLTVSRLKSVISEAKFATGEDQLFLMDATVTLPYVSGKLKGNIELERLASRITLRLRIPQTITVTDKLQAGGSDKEIKRTFTSVSTGIRAWLAYGVDKASLDGNNSNVDFYSHVVNSEQSGNAFTADGNVYDRPNPGEGVSAATQDYVISMPFYTYPHAWDPTEPINNTYISLRVYWHGPGLNEDGTITEETSSPTYYKIGVQPSVARIERNRSYEMAITLGKLGGTEPQRYVDVTAEWSYDMPWNKKDFETSVKELRYLILNNNDYDPETEAYVYTINDQTELSVPFSSSHPVEIESLDIEWDDMANNSTNQDYRILHAKLTGESGSKVSTAEGYVASTHLVGINPDNPKQLLRFRRDYTNYKCSGSSTITESGITIQTDREPPGPYIFTVTLKHTDNDSYKAKVRIIQYPAIYVTRILSGTGTPSESTSRRFINGYKTAGGSDSNMKGWVGNSSGYSNDYWLGSIHNDNNVSNRNIYTVHISRFATSDENDDKVYIIGDPRSRTVNNLPVNNNDWSRSGIDISDPAKNRTKYLTHYYPAEDNAEYARFIAPEFSVASQWGVTYDVNRDQAKRRCAAYQEQGKPAGRWRLPTTAEIEFIANLSCKGLIPYLFGRDGESADYWTATGGVNVTNGESPSVETDNGTSHAVRCVYDEWYWKGDDCDTNTFTWGDRERDITRSARLLRKYKK